MKRFIVSKHEIAKSTVPHELFLTNLIGNYFLMSIAVGEFFHVYPWTILVVPVISLSLMGYTFWGAFRSRTRESWYVMCHWQIAARHTRIFIFAQFLFSVVCLIGWMASNFGGLPKVAAIALVAGCVGLPMFMTMLILILLESQALHHANQCRLPGWVTATYPNPGVKVTDEGLEVQSQKGVLSPTYSTD
jgi:hypothetical protein